MSVRNIFKSRGGYPEGWHRLETPSILGIDELYENKSMRRMPPISRSEPYLNCQSPPSGRGNQISDDNENPATGRNRHRGLVEPNQTEIKTPLPWFRLMDDKFHIMRMADDILEIAHKDLRKKLKLSRKTGKSC
ncbi:hypothetical protein GCM10011274_41960 [Paraglaciecola chathamensis]|jgi:hypothetical protein|uniref:Uncharacterized protein n=1 Tax=Paraglaciecola chathamensis TaxID=368405 RepID=A0A8H9IJ54_9ALTE|nr:hypothetical protein GCM10011274_41960 [Paraglaciecola oceanifecundans]